jgi:hypothetical protein
MESKLDLRVALKTGAGHALCAGFASDLWAEIKGFDIHTWICGHSHDNETWTGKGKHGPIRFVMNGRGYPGEEVEFDPAFVLEV